jgi:hypothetical protein
LFINEDLEKEAKKGIANLTFYTNKRKEWIISLKKDKNSKINIKGIFNLGLVFEKEFLKKSNKVKTKNAIEKEIKTKVLENALLASFRGKIDIKEVLKYLTR